MAANKKQRASESKLTEKAIQRQVGERSFRLGRDYFDANAIYDCRRQGEWLKARCQGRSADYYLLSAQVKEGRIAKAECSCPVGEGGSCKHVAALLLTWLHEPEEFHETEPLEKRLAGCSQAQLIRLIEQVTEQAPDLESWLELALPTVATAGDKVVKPDAYRRQTVAAFASAGYGWEADRELTAALESLKKIGDQFRTQKNAASAVAVYCGILEGFMSEYETFQDETGNVTSVAIECLQALGKCLSQLAAGSEARGAAMKLLFRVLRYDINFGGMGLSDEVPAILRKQATTAERATIAGWIRKEVSSSKQASDDGFVRQWGRGAWGGLLLEMEGEPTDDEAYLRHCREFGLTGDLIERLLERRRLDDALREIRSSSDYELMGHADRLVAHKHVALAHSLVQERLAANPQSKNQWQLRQWLERFYLSQKNWASLLTLCVEGFRERPSLGSFQEIRTYAKKLKRWESLRPELLASVPPHSPELIRIYLAEGEVGQAIALLETCPKNRLGFGWDRVDLEVAEAAEKSHPETALKIYQAEAEQLIAARGRERYQSACEHLKKVKRLFSAVGRPDDWNAYLVIVREQNRSLRALQEELARAKL